MAEVPRILFNPVLSPGSQMRLGSPGPGPPLAPEPTSTGPDNGTSLGSVGSIQSLGSVGSILSIGSAGSILSIGSAGSILSIGSAGSVLCIGSVGSVASIGSAFSTGAIGGWARHRPRVVEAAATTLAVAALVVAALRPAA